MKRKSNIRPDMVGELFKSPKGELFILQSCDTEPTARMVSAYTDPSGNKAEIDAVLSEFSQWIHLREDKPRKRKAKEKPVDGSKLYGATVHVVKPRKPRSDKGQKRTPTDIEQKAAQRAAGILDITKNTVPDARIWKAPNREFRIVHPEGGGTGCIAIGALTYEAGSLKESALAMLEQLALKPEWDSLASYFGENEPVDQLCAILGIERENGKV